HSSHDRSFVNRLAIDLRAKRLDVWYDQWELDVGESFVDRLQGSLDACSHLIVVLSPHSVKSRWVQEELNAFLVQQLAEQKKRVLPVLYRDCILPAFLRGRVFADFRIDYQGGFHRLVRSIERHYELTYDEKAQRRAIRKAGHLLAHGFSDYSYKSQLPIYQVTLPLNLLATRLQRESLGGVWLGPSGRLKLETNGAVVRGQYDWQRREWSGMLDGEFMNEAILFEWRWPPSGEAGSGLFYHPIDSVLIGGWWMEFDLIDAKALLTTHEMPPNYWTFSRG